MASDLHKTWLLDKVREMEPLYNPDIRMLRQPFRSPGYHTTLKNMKEVHPTRETMIYALALLDTELPEYEQRAFDIMEQLVSMQDQHRDHETYGIWPWFYEESLEQMSPPDWNWADFLGKQLVLATKRHAERMPHALREQIRDAVFRACDAIIKRNVRPGYTNIAIMGAFVTLVGGETFGRTDYEEYGLARLEKIYRFTLKTGAFQEYNSPSYAIISVLELSKIREETRSAAAKSMCNELLDIAWRMIAEHFHVATKQWAGPHSRCYSTLLTDVQKSFLQVATDGIVTYFSPEDIDYSTEWYRSGIACPEELLDHFVHPQTRTVRQLYMLDEANGIEKRSATYMTPSFAIGSASREIMWNQCRNLVAYVDHDGAPVYFHLRLLHDGYDYSSAVFTSAQHEGTVLFGLHFLQQGGDTHPVLDPIDGTIEASNLRIRLECGGNMGEASWNTSGTVADMNLGDVQTRIELLDGRFGDRDNSGGLDHDDAFRWEVVREQEHVYLDCVLYQGERKRIDFTTMTRAAFVFLFSMGNSTESTVAHVHAEDGTIRAAAAIGEHKLQISIPEKPVV